MAEESGARESLSRWERLCSQFETLIGEWLRGAAIPDTTPDESELDSLKRRREWASQLASVSMAAQRIAGLRLTLIEQASGEETDGGEAFDPAERRHWEALAQEEVESDAD